MALKNGIYIKCCEGKKDDEMMYAEFYSLYIAQKEINIKQLKIIICHKKITFTFKTLLFLPGLMMVPRLVMECLKSNCQACYASYQNTNIHYHKCYLLCIIMNSLLRQENL